MKGLISGIKRMEIHDGDGLRTTVFLKGCPLKCLWCHNPESISFEKQIAFFKDTCISCGICENKKNENTAENCPTGALVLYGKEYETDELAAILLQDKAFFENSGGGVTLSGGECLAQPDFAVELAENLNKNGISIDIDTCGYVKYEIYEKIIPFTDTFLYDIKAIDASVHKKLTGKNNKLILENLKRLSENGCKIEIRYPLVKEYNDGECDTIGAFLCDLKGIEKVKVLPYHSFAASRYEALEMTNTLPAVTTTYQHVERAVKMLKGYGLHAVNGFSNS